MLLVARVGLTLYPQGAITSGGGCLSAYEDTTSRLERSVVEVRMTSSSFIGEDIQHTQSEMSSYFRLVDSSRCTQHRSDRVEVTFASYRSPIAFIFGR